MFDTDLSSQTLFVLQDHSSLDWPMVIFKKTTLGFGLACLVIFAAMIYSNLSTSNLIDSTHLMVRHMEVLNEIEKVSSLFATAQNNLRTYYATDQDYYREHYETAREGLQKSLKQVTELVPEHSEDLVRLNHLMQEKLKAWDNSFALKKKGGFALIRERLRASEGKNQDLVLFDVIKSIKREQGRIFAERMENAREQAKQARQITVLGGLLACLLISVAALLVYRDNRRRQRAESEIDRFFTLSLDLLCIAGMDGYFKRLSPSYADTLGYSLKELYSRPILDFVHPEDVVSTSAQIASQLGGNKVMGFENRFRCRDGSYRTLSWKSVPVGNLMYAVARDVTEQKKFEIELVAAREAAHNAAVTKSTFLANMSHEIRTPLNGVIGMTDLLARTSLDAEQKSFMGAIRSSAEILLRIVNEILDFSKIEAGRVQLETVDFELDQVIEGRISLVGIAAHEKGLMLETSLDPKVPKVLRGDSNKIGQVLLNLLNNAVKFTDKGKITVTVELRALDTTQCWLKVSVRDTGIGISAAEQARLFEPFVQADKSTARKYGGTGLGLSICKRYVEMMNGEIGVESQAGQGSIFWFSIPLEISEAKSVASRPTSPSRLNRTLSPEEMARRKSVRILIAEDNHINQVIVMNMMNALGYSAQVAQNGREAVEQFAKQKPDLILMDQHMPVMDGVEASTEIRRLEGEGHPRTPIIAFTATVIQEAERLQFKNLMDDFLLKPVTLDTLETVLNDWENRIAGNRS